MKRKVTFPVAIMAMSIGLIGCGAPTHDPSVEKDASISEGNSNEHITEETIQLSDGRVVTCILYDYVREAGIDCDWAGAKLPVGSS